LCGTDSALVGPEKIGHLAEGVAERLRRLIGIATDDTNSREVIYVRPFPTVIRTKRLQLPLFAGQPRNETPFDIGEVGYHQFHGSFLPQQ
jgi:hypothetical protein